MIVKMTSSYIVENTINIINTDDEDNIRTN